ncbi:MAG: PD40 domain-containing protein [Fimbriimonadaceae bacterium]|nr:PD40 domain-containing protein [Fimbriimonadaceae bacterium]
MARTTRKVALGTLLLLSWLLLPGCGGGGAAVDNSPFQAPSGGDAGFDRIPLRAVLPGQYLVPVQVGNQVFELLLDTGFQGLLVFGDLIRPTNHAVRRTGRPAVLRFGSGTRRGEFATAPVALGRRTAVGVRLVVIDEPTSREDRSLSLKGAQGILGLRFKPGTGGTANRLDPLLLQLAPVVRALEFDLPQSGAASLVLGGAPVLSGAGGRQVFTAQTTTALNPDRVRESYADLEVPFQMTSSAGVAATPGLRVLLDTGAVDELILDTAVAVQLGYDPAGAAWRIAGSEVLTVELLGSPATLRLPSPIRVDQVLVTDLSAYSVDAVLGVGVWQPYVISFEFVDWTLGGPAGTFRFLHRAEAGAAAAAGAWDPQHYTPLPGLNSSAEDSSPTVSSDGRSVVFNSDRPGGVGLRDIYLYRLGSGLVALPGLNSAARDESPSLSGDGGLVAFTSDRPGGGGWDIYLYDVAAGSLVDLPGLNTAELERAPQLSPTGRWLSFRSERAEGGTTRSRIYVYDRQTASLLATPGLDGGTDQYTSRVSADGRLLAYDADRRPGDRGLNDVHLYDLVAQREVPLSSAVNSTQEDLFVSLSADGRYLGFQTNRWGADLGSSGDDVAVFDLQREGPDGRPGVLVDLPGLSLTGFGDTTPSLSADGQRIVFVSQRARGTGGPDLYLYERPPGGARTVRNDLDARRW